MRLWIQAWFTPQIFRNAVKIALVVGSILNVINQGGSVMNGEAIDWWRLGLNYLVPYCVSSYSAVRIQQAGRGRD